MTQPLVRTPARWFRLGFVVLAAAFVLCAAPRLAAGERAKFKYQYYDIWWRQHRATLRTSLMLHFGPPQPHAWTVPGNARLKKKQPKKDEISLDDLGDLEEADDSMVGGLAEKLAPVAETVRDLKDRAPAGKVYDYSSHKFTFPLPEGATKVPEGKFGPGLKLDGSTGLTLKLGGGGGAELTEGWFKPDGLPEKPACLMASARGGPRLMLRPDGHLELTGTTAERNEELQLVSDKPIQPGRWTHVAAYVFIAKHIEQFPSPVGWYEYRLAIDGRVAATIKRKTRDKPGAFLPRGRFTLGMDQKGEHPYAGLIDEVRVAEIRRFNEIVALPWRDEKAERPLVFGPPHFEKDSRVFHASFESKTMTVSRPPDQSLQWDLGEHAFETFQVDGVRGKALLVDPAMGFPRIPIQGLDPLQGSLELWFQPFNWDNHTDFGKWHPADHEFRIARFVGKHKKTGKKVVFMTLTLTHATVHGESIWIHPGAWSHFLWTWGPNEDGEQPRTVRAQRFGELMYRAQLQRNVDVLAHVEPLYLELGIPEKVPVIQGQRPAILVDEIVGYDTILPKEAYEKTLQRWQGTLKP